MDGAEIFHCRKLARVEFMVARVVCTGAMAHSSGPRIHSSKLSATFGGDGVCYLHAHPPARIQRNSSALCREYWPVRRSWVPSRWADP